jgi:hypothetical protein
MIIILHNIKKKKREPLILCDAYMMLTRIRIDTYEP